jgi:hypothetical protein
VCLKTNTRFDKGYLTKKRVRCIDVRFLVSAFVGEGLELRRWELHREGNLFTKEGAAVLMRDLVCNPQAALLKFLNLSGTRSVAPPASSTMQMNPPTLTALWRSCA